MEISRFAALCMVENKKVQETCIVEIPRVKTSEYLAQSLYKPNLSREGMKQYNFHAFYLH